MTTATDSYALGVTLYQLLCGVLPWPGGTTPLAMAMNRMRDDVLPRPSSRVTNDSAVAGRKLRGDLDAIDDALVVRADLAEEGHVLHAERLRAAGEAAPRGEKFQALPHGVHSPTPRHHRIAEEVAAVEPVVEAVVARGLDHTLQVGQAVDRAVAPVQANGVEAGGGELLHFAVGTIVQRQARADDPDGLSVRPDDLAAGGGQGCRGQGLRMKWRQDRSRQHTAER